MISEKIVVVDDDVRVIQSFKIAFPEYEIIEFTDSEEAVSFFKKTRDIHLVLLDVMMPGLDGLEVLEEIRSINKDIAVIIMTAYGSQDVAIRALQNHADDFVEKPFKVEILKDKIRKLLRQRFYFKEDVDGDAYKVERIKNYVRRNYNFVSLEAVADEMCLSSKHISRMFKSQTGMSFRDYYLNERVAVAKKMLQETSLSVNEISYKLGYQNAEAFMRMFKRKTALTPSDFREGRRNG